MKLDVNILILILIFTISLDAYACQEDDYIALRALYMSTDGDNWSNNTGWLTAAEFTANPTLPAGTDFTNWHGVTLDGNGCVNGLYLAFNQLSGAIPPDLGNLNNLNFLSLNFNQLSGSIPSELGDLNLITLGLSDNLLSGCYDSNLANLCTQLNPNFNTNSSISIGNNLDAPWEDFCATGAGACAETCPSDIIINDIPIPDSLYQAQQTITSSGHVVSGTNVVFQAGQLIMLDTNFTVQPGGSLTIGIEDCQ